MLIAPATKTFSQAGRRRLLARAGEPLFLARWERTVFVHYETEPSLLERQVPFQLDLYQDRAFVSLVAFTLVGMRPRVGGRLGEWVFRPIASHEFLNVRTYVRHAGEPGIYFLAEWLSNRLSVALGPRIFGLPYRHGHLDYAHKAEEGKIAGKVTAKEGTLEYRATAIGPGMSMSEPGSEIEFLLERYTAFTDQYRRRFFRVWHEPWEQTAIDIDVTSTGLIASTGTWWSRAKLIGAQYSLGTDVWMGRPHRTVETEDTIGS